MTDWQIVNLYFNPAIELSRLIAQRNGGQVEIGKVVDKDDKGKPVVPSLAFLVSKYMAAGCPREISVTRAKEQIEAFKKQHGLK